MAKVVVVAKVVVDYVIFYDQLLFIMRFVRSYPTIWGACIALVFAQPSDFTSEDLFFPSTPDDDSNFVFLDDDYSALSSYSTELINYDVDDSATLTDPLQTLLADAPPPDECLIYTLPPSSRIRARGDSCIDYDHPAAVGGRIDDDDNDDDEGKTSLKTAEEVQKYLCPESKKPIAGFGSVPVCSSRNGISSEEIFREFEGIDPLAGFFRTHFFCALSKILWVHRHP